MTDSNKPTAIDRLNLNEIISKPGVLEGITWRQHHVNARDPLYAKTHELHIGTLGDFQIQLSLDEDTKDYMMQFWELTAVPQRCDEANRYCTVPQYTPLILNKIITAADLDEAKCIAVKSILEYACDVYEAATERYNTMLLMFGDLGATLAAKVARRRKTDSVVSLGLMPGTLRTLERLNIRVIGQLTSMTVKDFKAVSGLGDKSRNDILARLHANHMRLADETTPDITAMELKRSIATAEAAEKAATAEQAEEDAQAEVDKTAADDAE